MQTTMRTEYAIRALLELSSVDENTLLPLKMICKKGELPQKFLEHLFKSLKDAGIVTSRKGKNGGYKLKRKPSEITLYDIFKAVDYQIIENNCNKLKNKEYCIGKPCILSEIWKDIEKKEESIYNSITLKDIIDKNKERG